MHCLANISPFSLYIDLNICRSGLPEQQRVPRQAGLPEQQVRQPMYGGAVWPHGELRRPEPPGQVY